MKLTIRKARKSEYKEIAKIYAKSFSEYPYNKKWSAQNSIKAIKDYSIYCDIWSLVYNKMVVGFYIMNTKRWVPGEVVFGEEMAIKKEFRNKGFGSFLFKEMFKIYKKKGFKAWLGIVDRKAPAYKIYKKMGIKESKMEGLIEKKLK